MLIICSGPDTWSARHKAHELMEAFRVKHDPSGFSTETLSRPDVPALLNRLSAPSFFSTKRMIRCDGLFEKIKIADVRALAKRIAEDQNQTIVLTLETEPPSDKHVHEFQKEYLFSYSYPLRTGSSFLSWCKTQAASLGVSEQAAIRVAEATDGDSWAAQQELEKLSANPNAPLAAFAGEESSSFEVVDAALAKPAGWRSILADAEMEQVLPLLLSQTRSALRCRDGETEGIHPYVVKKLRALKTKNSEQDFLRAVRCLVASRSGVSQASESDLLF